MAQAIPLATRASPSAGGTTHSEVDLSQVLLMARAGWWGGHAQLDAALNGEGLTMPNGELNTGAYGEGYVDRRHPHTYVHELMLSGQGAAGPLLVSLGAGRGFAPFGTDDPMMRPLVKFPINHHLSQILERGLLVGAARLRGIVLEAATFDGDEPSSPSSLPRARRFGDSWSVRGTVLPSAATELQASYARVASPEQPSGFGLDQRKQSVSGRYISGNGARYALAEWAHTVEVDHSRGLDIFAYESALLEGAARVGVVGVAIRVEQTERPEEDRLLDPFRTPRPPSDLSINGITRWRVVAAQLSAPAVTTGMLSGFPFVEVARLAAAPRDPRQLFTPDRLYGTSRFWMVTAGVRLRLGDAHARMGRYGVAMPAGPAIGTMLGGAGPVHAH
ncbi:MAG: hypothetical protein ABJE47_02610 [bacterium]